MNEELDKVSRQIILAIGDEGAKMSDLEDKVDAARQTIWNRVDVLVAKGYVKEKRDKFPPTRHLTLTEKSNDVLRAQRAVAYTESAEALGTIFGSQAEQGKLLSEDRVTLLWSYALLFAVEKLTAGYTKGKLVGVHQKASDMIQPVRKLAQELEPEQTARIERHLETLTKDTTDHGKRLKALMAISEQNLARKELSRKFLDTKVDVETRDFYINARKLFKTTQIELMKQTLRELTSPSKLA